MPHSTQATHPIWQIPPAGSRTSAQAAAAPSSVAAAILGIGVALAVLAPWFVHLAPAAAPGLGPTLLPMFYAPLLAALLLRLPLAVAISALTPVVARLMTGLPADPVLPGLVLQIALFAAAVRLLRRYHWSYAVPGAYLIALAATAVITALVPALASVSFLTTLRTGLPGIVVLSAFGAVAQRTLR